MLVLVEGMERCGKTSTVNYVRSIIQNPRIIVHHCAKPPKGLNHRQQQTWAAMHYTETMQKFTQLSTAGWDIIMDRAHIGEYVYGHMYRNNLAADDYMYYCEDFVDMNNTYLLLLTDEPTKVMSREDGLSMSMSIDKITTEKQRFVEGFNKSKITNKMHIDWTDYDANTNTDFATLFKKYTNGLQDFLEIF